MYCRVSVYASAKKGRLCLEIMPYRLLCTLETFTSCLKNGVSFLRLFVTVRAPDDATAACEQPPLRLNVRSAFRAFSDQGLRAVCKGISNTFAQQGLPFNSV